MPSTYDVHPEIGYFCPAPRMRRELRAAVVSDPAGMAIGAPIMAIHAGQAAETEAVSGQYAAEIVGFRPVGGRASSKPRIKDADNDAKADPVETIKPHPMRMVRVSSSKALLLLAGIPLARTEPPEPPAGGTTDSSSTVDPGFGFNQPHSMTSSVTDTTLVTRASSGIGTIYAERVALSGLALSPAQETIP